MTKGLGSHRVLEGVGFRLEASDGRLVALLGLTGAGKSSLLRILAGLENPDSGELLGPGGKALDTARVGLVLQHSPLFRHRTVAGNLEVAGRAAGLSRVASQARAELLLARFRLSSHAARYPSELSGGQRQLLSIAQQLVTGKSVLLLDEPFAALDRASAKEVVRWLRRVTTSGETQLVLVVTHDIALALHTTDRTLVLGSGDLRGARILRSYDCRPNEALDVLQNEHRLLELEREIETLLTVLWQEHAKLRIFVGRLDPSGELGRLANDVTDFASTVAAKSIGVEALRSSGLLIVSLGYREDESPYAVTLEMRWLGDLDESAVPDEGRVERELLAASKTVGPILCHEVYSPDGQRFAAVFLTLR